MTNKMLCTLAIVLVFVTALPLMSQAQEPTPKDKVVAQSASIPSTSGPLIPANSDFSGNLKVRGELRAAYSFTVEEVSAQGVVKCRVEIMGTARSGNRKDPCKQATLIGDQLSFETEAGRKGSLTYVPQQKMLRGIVFPPKNSPNPNEEHQAELTIK